MSRGWTPLSSLDLIGIPVLDVTISVRVVFALFTMSTQPYVTPLALLISAVNTFVGVSFPRLDKASAANTFARVSALAGHW